MEERQTLDLDVTGSTPVSPATFHEVWDEARVRICMYKVHRKYFPQRMYTPFNMCQEYRWWGKVSGSFQTRSGT